MAGNTLYLGGHTIEVSHADKLLFPGDGITKSQVVDYYRRISRAMLPLIRGHPVTMQRFPDGIEGEGFFQKDVPDYFPDWVRTVSVEKEKGRITHLLCDNTATLVYLANQACITPHIWLSRRTKLHHPDRMIIDLDPGKGFEPVLEAAGCLRTMLEEIGLRTFVMTTGSRGLHVVVPLDGKSHFDTVRSFARDVAEACASRHRERLTTEQRLNKRQGRVFLDVMRNAYAQTAVAPYALRAKPGAPVATPLEWDEVAQGGFSAQRYTIKNIFPRVNDKGDVWAQFSRWSCSIEKSRIALDNMLSKIGSTST